MDYLELNWKCRIDYEIMICMHICLYLMDSNLRIYVYANVVMLCMLYLLDCYVTNVSNAMV